MIVAVIIYIMTLMIMIYPFLKMPNISMSGVYYTVLTISISWLTS